MWKLLTIYSAFGLVLSVIATEVAREIFSRLRANNYSAGGTQDIALWGTIFGSMCFIVMLASAIMWALV
jgi:hypothetical protein